MKEFSVEKLDNGFYRLLVSKRIYEKQAILNTTYKLSSIAFFALDSYDDSYVSVLFRFNEAKTSTEIDKFTDDFYAELLDQQIRAEIDDRTCNIKEAIYNKAFNVIRSIK